MRIDEDERLKITVFGDSIGKGITTESGRPVVMKNSAVSLTEGAFGLSIDNRSVFGQSLKRLMERKQIERYLSTLDTSKRNVAVLELGGNDADFDWRKVAQAPNEFHDSHTSVKEFSRLYKEAIEILQDAQVRVVACTIVPIDSKRFFDNVIGMVADKEKVLEFFYGDFNTIHRHQEMFNNEILKNAYAHGLPVIDLREKFLQSNVFDDLMCLDGIHPNQMGQREIFNAVSEFIYALN
jgi:lysophospholipase L1-like esterase